MYRQVIDQRPDPGEVYNYVERSTFEYIGGWVVIIAIGFAVYYLLLLAWNLWNYGTDTSKWHK